MLILLNIRNFTGVIGLVNKIDMMSENFWWFISAFNIRNKSVIHFKHHRSYWFIILLLNCIIFIDYIKIILFNLNKSIIVLLIKHDVILSIAVFNYINNKIIYNFSICSADCCISEIVISRNNFSLNRILPVLAEIRNHITHTHNTAF